MNTPLTPRTAFVAALVVLFTITATLRNTASELSIASLRQPNTTIRMPLSPPVLGYKTVDAFDGLLFTNPVSIVSPSGENGRLFVLERAGRIVVITNLSQPSRTIFLDLATQVDSRYKDKGAEGLNGMAFHPGFATNGYFYVVYTTTARAVGGVGSYNRLSRFQVSPADPNQAIRSSELVLMMQRDEGYGHNWNDIHFGPDGYLYMAAGDEGDSQDQYQNSQRIDKDFFSGILRIDVDKRPGNLPPNPHPSNSSNYAIPADNPFVGITSFQGAPVDPTKVRTEFYAIGLRNPWRMSFDPVSGNLYCGDVGQHAREEIDIIVKGGNYGWSYKEGTAPGFRGDPPPGVTFINPIAEYGRGYGTNQGTTVVGGFVYRGNRLPSIQGAYIFGDYTSGNIWALRHGSGNTAMEWLVSDPGISAFGQDPRNGDILFVDHEEGKVKRLDYLTSPIGSAIPNTLVETGIFSDLATLTPHAGVLPYDINVSFWSDNALKKRWFSLPSTEAVIGFKPEGNWSFPEGTVWVKHFELELTNGVPESARRLETRVLVRTRDSVYGVTYKWNDSGTQAELVSQEGLNESFTIHDQGSTRTQVWRYPSRNECLTCHTPAGGYALGFNTEQLNRDFSYGRLKTNQIAALSSSGYFDSKVTNVMTLRALAHPKDFTQSLEYRVRSYLAVNCGYCHQPGGTGAGTFDARISTSLSNAGLIGGALIDNQQNSENQVVHAGAPQNSMLLQRISKEGTQRMPPVGSNLIDHEAIQLLTEWITMDLPQREIFTQWQVRHFGTSETPDAIAEADPDQDGSNNYAEFLTSTDPKDSSSVWKVEAAREGNTFKIQFPRIANRGFHVQSTTNIIDPKSWVDLDCPSNKLYFSATNTLSTVEDATEASSEKFYRVRITEP